MTEISRTQVNILGSFIDSLDCFQVGFDYLQDETFTVAMQLKELQEKDDPRFTLVHNWDTDEETECQTWVASCLLDEMNELSIANKQKSMLLHNESVDGIFEYAANKIVITLFPKDILVLDNWETIRIVVEDHAGNDQKAFIAPLPGFDEDKFPFLVCNGYESLNLINLKDLKTEVLI